MGKKQGMWTTEKELIRELNKNHDAQEVLLRKLGVLQEQEKKVKEELQKLWKKGGGGGQHPPAEDKPPPVEGH